VFFLRAGLAVAGFIFIFLAGDTFNSILFHIILIPWFYVDVGVIILAPGIKFHL
jgi:hypothetical protein